MKRRIVGSVAWWLLPVVFCALMSPCIVALPVLSSDRLGDVPEDPLLGGIRALPPSGVAACEVRLAPRFERLGDYLEKHAHEFEAGGAHEAAHRLRVRFFVMMKKCIELEDAGAFEENEAEFELQVDQHWGFVKTHIAEPIKKHVVEPVKRHVVEPVVEWVTNGSPAPPAGNPPKTYSSWKAVQAALALSSVVYQEEGPIDYFLRGCSDPDNSTTFKIVEGKVDKASLDLMKQLCGVYTLFKKIAFIDNGRSVHGKDVGTEVLFLESEFSDDDLPWRGRRLLETSADKHTAAAFAGVMQKDASDQKWGFFRHHHRHHTHTPHRHHAHTPHRHHTHTPHSHTPHSHTTASPAFSNAGTIWIALRGSESVTDWKQNLKIVADPWNDGGGGKVHHGLLLQYLQIRQKLFETVDEYVKMGYGKFICTGHSLGGSLAELCAMAIAHRHANVVVQMITFGAPTAGNPDFAEAFNSKIPLATRIVNDRDIIPCLPGHNPISGIASRVAGLFAKGSLENPFTESVDHLLQWSGNAWRSVRWPSCARSWSIDNHLLHSYASIVLNHVRNGGGFDLSEFHIALTSAPHQSTRSPIAD